MVTSLGHGTRRAEREREDVSSSVESETIPATKKKGNDGAAAGLAGLESLPRLQLSFPVHSRPIRMRVSESDYTATVDSSQLLIFNPRRACAGGLL